MSKKTLRDVDLKNKRVLMRVDFNVPIEAGKVKDDTRIAAALESIRYVLAQGASLVLMSHLDRPEGKVVPSMSLKQVVGRLSERLGQPVQFAPDCVGPEAEAMAKKLKPGQVLLLENLRFHPEEEGKPDVPKDAKPDVKKAAAAEMAKRQAAFAKKLAALGDVYADDAFGTAHRPHASISVVTRHFKDCVAGFLLEKEIRYLSQALENPKRPFVAILGGAKVADKIGVIKTLANKVDTLLIGGAMTYTIYLAQGRPVGKSKIEQDKTDVAKDILKTVEKGKARFLMPVDHVVAEAPKAGAPSRVVGENEIADGWMALDIGPKTVELYAREVAKAGTVVWNGPMGLFEKPPFDKGTTAIAKAIAANPGCLSVIGGGDSVDAINHAGLADKITHISTGGGASLELLQGLELPGLAALTDK